MKTLVAIAALLSEITLVACAPHSNPALDGALKPLAGASDVRELGEPGRLQVTYHLDATYPATSELAAINQQLVGWQARERDFMNPDVPTSNARGWQSFGDLSGKVPVCQHQWIGEWQNSSGDVVWYALRFTTPLPNAFAACPEAPNNRNLAVAARRFTRDQVTALQKIPSQQR